MALMPNPMLLYAVAGALVIGVASGYKVRDWQCDAAFAKALEKAEKLRVKKQEVVDNVSQTYEFERDQANVVANERTNTIREIYKTAPAVPVDCSAPDATSAGGHFNPDTKAHGMPGSGSNHAGDMPNIKSDANGNAVYSTKISGFAVNSGPTGILGKSVVVHRDPDDYKSQPAGNSGPRIACGLIK